MDGPMDRQERLTAATQNNVDWCEALCALHGAASERHPTHWIQRGAVPPYMSNLVTLAGPSHEREQIAAIESLIAADPARCFSVKDAFQCLDLDRLGFHVLFHATWLFFAASTPSPDPAPDACEWSLARTDAELEIWERTWRGTPNNADARAHPRIFLPQLLERPEFHFLIARRDGAPVGTAALNRSAHAVGISNVFSESEPPLGLYSSGIRAARTLYPHLPIVGYDRDAGLAAALAAGFEAVHGLTVWNRHPH
jgi:hypothetical protein